MKLKRENELKKKIVMPRFQKKMMKKRVKRKEREKLRERERERERGGRKWEKN
jgi:hypothetical protein